MKKTVFFGALVGAGLVAGASAAATLDDIKDRGKIHCGVTEGTLGFSARDSEGNHQGFDVDFCRALGAAIFNDSDAVEYIELSSKNRFTALSSGQVDLLYRTTTWTFSRDVDLKTTFVGINYYDGQGFMVPKELGVTSAKELEGATVCIETGTTTELNLADFFRVNGMSYEPLPVGGTTEAKALFEEGACDVYTTDASALAGVRAALKDPAAYIILPEIVSKEPLGPAVRHGDDEWADVVRWVQNALVAAEETGVTSANVAELAKGTDNPEINRMLGSEGSLGAMLGLDADFAVRAIAAVGNYGEIFERNIGENTPIGLARGLNALWTEGGLQYSPPFR
ncbi:amino acid ABC transporter substrate-binding protein [Poseidonocella sedimentorum]|uniref:L-glutamine-binding protein /L-glutamate-binding protein /L-aspartate-binding protein /L-asparagine-binding protein n=1 Tax=Poseidonocella sedimentorum TaxID=871652 RepID=A0A1I6DMG6_9RHOB|nr:amino acid ABC transporter substrate-binding protein [Poseidonocella sedimentorum]SFR06693.1 L-glutamine-binding protein /L-glutamate-binding protein /L-aspartate-binding protein /L-asparagine-binding protein [Poseidonocella sedimentorum]